MKQLNFSRVFFAVAAFAAAVAWAQGDAPVKDKPTSDAARASGASRSDGAEAEDAPPAWA